MILAIDTHYKEDYAKTVGVIFNWQDEKPQEIICDTVMDVAPYQSGEFYKRELPCILHLLGKIDLSTINLIIVDGFVFVGNDNKPGLGAYLWEKLKREIPIVGVAKKHYLNTDKVSISILRGESEKPLLVSSVGTDLVAASQNVQRMKGRYRIPAILKELDRITKLD